MFDVIIKNGNVVDGTDAKPFVSDVGIKGESISEIGDLSNERADIEIDAAGKHVAPGFIDVNNHSDTYWRLFLNPDLESLIYQGITTIIGGNCGSSLAPLKDSSIIRSVQKWVDVSSVNINWLSTKELFEFLESKSFPVNFGMLVGHSTIRRGIIGDAVRNLTEEELKLAQKMLSDALDAGALGMSTGLAYTHARLAGDDELATFAKEVSKRGKVCAAHVRGEASELREAVKETLRIAAKSKASTQISHLKVMGEPHRPLLDQALALIEDAHENGVAVNFDVYPYTSTGSVLYILLPDWVAEGGKRSMIARLKDKIIREKIIEEMRQTKEHDYAKVTIASSPLNKSLIRRKIVDIARVQNKSVEEAVIDILIASEGRVITTMDVLNEEDVKKLLVHPLSIIATDGAGYNTEHAKTGETVHPRCFGAFPRLLGRYVRDQKVLPLQKAIAKITSIPAQKYGIKRRGKIAKGCFADIVVFDLANIADKADERDPYRYAQGIEWVITNGNIALKEGAYTGKRSGQLLRY